MPLRRAARCAALSIAIAQSACNAQFDFDTHTSDLEDGSITTDAGTPPPDAAPPAPQIACGAATCTLSGCCSTTATAYCVEASDAGTCSGVLVQCDDARDCPQGQVCCAEGSGTRLSRAHCETQDHCLSSHFVMLCDPNDPMACKPCVASSLAPLPAGYHQCGGMP